MYANRWLKMAALYFVVGSTVGMVMSILQVFTAAPVHAHINLLGWVSMAIIGGLYKLFPTMEQSKLAVWHFWVYQIGFPPFMVALFMILTGNPLGEKLIPIGSSATLIAIILTAVQVWTNVKGSGESAAGTTSRAVGQ